MIKRWIKRLLKVLLALAVLLVVFLLFERLRGQISLSRYKQKLIAQGEKLSPQDFVQSFSEADNGAPAAISAIERLQEGPVLPMNVPPVMKLLTSGRAIVGFREREWVESGTRRDGKWVDEKVTNRWDQLAADLKANEATLAEIRAALSKPVLNNRLNLADGMKAHFTHLAPAKSLTRWLGAESQLALHEGKTYDALNSVLVQVRLPRVLVEDHVVISELVRIAIAAIAEAHTWEALQAEQRWTDEDLVLLQKAWESQEFASAMARSLDGERVFCDVSAEMIRRSNQDAFDALFGLGSFFPGDDSEWSVWERLTKTLPLCDKAADFVKKEVYCRVWRFAWSHQDQRQTLENIQSLLTILRMAAEHKSYVKALPELERFSDAVGNKHFYDRLRFRSSSQSARAFSKLVRKVMRAETGRSVVLCAIALKRCQLRYGKFPVTLNTLIPEFLVAVPIDYMDGKPVKYRLNEDGSFSVYSVSEDGKDDGGDASLPPDKGYSRNLWNRRDFVWPAAASPEEAKAWRQERAKN